MDKNYEVYRVEYGVIGHGSSEKKVELIKTSQTTYPEQIKQVLFIFKERLTRNQLAYEDVIVYSLQRVEQ